MEVHAYHAALGVVLFELPSEGGERSGFKWPGLVSRPSTPEQVAEASMKKDHALVLSLETQGSSCTWSLAVGLLPVAHGEGDEGGALGQQEVMEHALRHPESKRKDFWAALSWAKRAHDGNILLPSRSSAVGAAAAASEDAEPDQGSLDSSETSKSDHVNPVAPPGESAAPPGASVAPPGESAAPPATSAAPFAAASPPTASLALLRPPTLASLPSTAPIVADSKSPSQHQGKIGGGGGA